MLATLDMPAADALGLDASQNAFAAFLTDMTGVAVTALPLAEDEDVDDDEDWLDEDEDDDEFEDEDEFEEEEEFEDDDDFDDDDEEFDDDDEL